VPGGSNQKLVPSGQEGLGGTQTYKVPVAPHRLAGSGLSEHAPLGHARRDTTKQVPGDHELVPLLDLGLLAGCELSFGKEVVCSRKQRKT